jgi:hypothetical protein
MIPTKISIKDFILKKMKIEMLYHLEKLVIKKLKILKKLLLNIKNPQIGIKLELQKKKN